jgi:hypothetical protein
VELPHSIGYAGRMLWLTFMVSSTSPQGHRLVELAPNRWWRREAWCCSLVGARLRRASVVW